MTVLEHFFLSFAPCQQVAAPSRHAVKVLLMSGMLACALPGLAQTQTHPTPTPAASAAVNEKEKDKSANGVSWTELTPAQKQALAPLATSWNTSMSESQKRKWLETSKNYSVLSPQQRAQARLNFGKAKELSRQLTPEEKKAKWEAYQTLSPEEKRKLAEKGSPKPTGAATAVKPVSPQKLATVPAHSGKLAPASAPKITPSPQPTIVKVPEVPMQPASPANAIPVPAPIVDMH